MSVNDEIFEVIVVGAGIMGSVTAYYLSKKLGNKVLLLEQFDLLHRRGSSHGDSRIIRYTYPQDFYTFLMKEAYELWVEAEKEAGTQVLRKTGGLDFGKSDNKILQSVIESVQKYEIPHQILSPAQVSKKFPVISIPANYTGVYCPDTGVLNATKAVAMFQKLAYKNGCKIIDNVKITGIKVMENSENNSTFEIVAKGHEKKFLSKKCVITSGAWTQKIIEMVQKPNLEYLKLTLPLNPVQVTVGYWPVEEPAEYSGFDNKFPVFINYEDGIIYGSPALEFPNMIKCGHDFGQECDPDKRDFLPGDEEIQKYILPFLKTAFKNVKTTIAPRTESCMFTLTPDHNFILDKVPQIDNLFVGCGFSGHGFKLSPVVGKILTGFVMNGEGPYSASVLNNFKIDRFL